MKELLSGPPEDLGLGKLHFMPFFFFYPQTFEDDKISRVIFVHSQVSDGRKEKEVVWSSRKSQEAA